MLSTFSSKKYVLKKLYFEKTLLSNNAVRPSLGISLFKEESLCQGYIAYTSPISLLLSFIKSANLTLYALGKYEYYIFAVIKIKSIDKSCRYIIIL